MKETWSTPKVERLSIAKVTKDQYWQAPPPGNSYWNDTHAGKNEPNNGYNSGSWGSTTQHTS